MKFNNNFKNRIKKNMKLIDNINNNNRFNFNSF